MHKTGHMIAVLDRAEKALPALLTASDNDWNTLDILYEPPRVERAWMPFENEYRLYLHRIHPLPPTVELHTLYHPHPWPSAMRVRAGFYEMHLGHGGSRYPTGVGQSPPIAATLTLMPGSSYEMIDIDAWHSVRPIGNPAYSVMVTGPRWDRWSPKAPHELMPLDPVDKKSLLDAFRTFYILSGRQ